jgi:hypothetical protein
VTAIVEYTERGCLRSKTEAAFSFGFSVRADLSSVILNLAEPGEEFGKIIVKYFI